MQHLVDALVLAARNSHVVERFAVTEMPRLSDLSVQGSPIAEFAGRFFLVDGRCAVDGRVTATVRAICQRCMQPMEWAVDDAFQVVLVDSEEAMQELADTQDSVVAKPTQLDLAWLTEEQLLLAMPLVPLHSQLADCAVASVPVGQSNAPAAESTSKQAEPTQKPFADLRKLMQRQ
jgi:uncharacterized protein